MEKGVRDSLENLAIGGNPLKKRLAKPREER